TSLTAGFGWVHFGLRRVLEAKNDAFLERKAAELLAGVADHRPGGMAELEAEIRREVLAYEPEGLIVVVRQPDHLSVYPGTTAGRQLAARSVPLGSPVTVALGETGQRCRVLAMPSRNGGLTLEVGISLAETEATLVAFDRVVAGGALAFLVLAVAGGLFL